MFFKSEGTLKTTQLSTYLQNPPKHPPRVPNLVKNDVSMAKWASKIPIYGTKIILITREYIRSNLKYINSDGELDVHCGMRIHESGGIPPGGCIAFFHQLRRYNRVAA